MSRITKQSTSSRPRKQSLYLRIADKLRQEIHERYSPGQALPPQRELADRFGASYVTVGNAVAQLVAEGLVRRVVRSGTYVNDPAKTSRGVVGIVASTSAPTYMTQLFGRIEADLRTARLRTMLFGGTASYEDELRAFHDMGRFREAGLIIYSFFQHRFAPQIAALRGRGIPAVALFRPIDGLDLVASDHRMVGVLQARHVVEAGYRRVLYIGRSEQDYGRLQREGFLETLAQERRLETPVMVVAVHGQPGEDGERAIREQIGRITAEACADQAPDVIVTYGDRYLPVIADVLVARGLVPGQDVRLVGADDMDLRGFSYTTVDHQLSEMGRQAVHLLLERIDGQYAGPPREQVVAPRLIQHTQAMVGPGEQAPSHLPQAQPEDQEKTSGET